jgi:CheY-like chemotaxis protein
MNTVDMLEDLGHAVTTVTSGRQALDRLGTTKFDVMVIGHEPDDLWNLDLREDDLADAGGERINVWASSPPSPMTARQRPTA